MKFPGAVTVAWIAELIHAETIGDTSLPVYGINEIHKVEAGDLCFVDHPKYYDKCLSSAATHIIINTKEVNVPHGKTLLVVAEPFEAYLTIVNHFRPFTPATKPVSDTAVTGTNTVIMPNVFIGKDVKIGNNCIIHPNVSIMDYTEIGNNVVIQAGTVIGSDAFYYNTKKNRDVWYRRMQSCGNVIIEDDVEIGAGCTIDRGVTASTRIGAGTKIDNMVHIGHDTSIGRNCLFAAQVGIAGACVIEDGVTLWGQVGVSKTLTIGANATVLAQSGIPSTVAGNKIYFGTPAEDAMLKKKEIVWIKRIPELWKKIME
ncbi:UDP-3-O-(3-hydroxymyristoyl)glucosamine N-acyltransferase [Panacibacter sp. DH6]|uniref:UDP-3-O-(3-hydroxymyristoyl)glucosamine N-acyltransferase n=1 Tax=Panacibacter microcysteis TaxID=2793269 RepID=A0A931E1J3_9BACT|nr:UDP-3-O-(3-hydroxymyristoyl)glucosamine N-acyltransferase [Panacibacter microcysteis]MBG9375363.1 UDP-3-O-(3-hydroxymyristoyl)glucosamine N-acyltransferase [Panacibacter microcysteis]